MLSISDSVRNSSLKGYTNLAEDLIPRLCHPSLVAALIPWFWRAVVRITMFAASGADAIRFRHVQNRVAYGFSRCHT